MDASTFAAFLAVLIGGAGVTLNYFALDESKRLEVSSFSKKWIGIAFGVAIFCNSCIGIYLFSAGASPSPSRSEVLMLLLHLVNLVSIPAYILLGALGQSLDARNEKRANLTAAVEALSAKVETLKIQAGTNGSKLH